MSIEIDMVYLCIIGNMTVYLYPSPIIIYILVHSLMSWTVNLMVAFGGIEPG